MINSIDVRRIVAIVLAIASLSLTACGQSPKGIIKDYFDQLDSGNINKATDYISDSIKSRLGDEKVRSAMHENARKLQYNGGLDKVEILAEDVHGDMAKVRYTLHFKNGRERNESLRLERDKKGEWKIAE